MTIRSNPKYQNICWVRVGTYRHNACVACSKKEECDSLYNSFSGEWKFNNGNVSNISKERTPTQMTKIKIRNRTIPKALWEINSDKIKTEVDELINENGAIYSDDLVKATGLNIETLRTWFKYNNFEKQSKHSKRWENKNYLKGIVL